MHPICQQTLIANFPNLELQRHGIVGVGAAVDHDPIFGQPRNGSIAARVVRVAASVPAGIDFDRCAGSPAP